MASETPYLLSRASLVRADDAPARAFPRHKRLLDLLICGLGLAVCGLPMVVIALMIRLDGGPAIYKQRRIGMNGRRFTCLKFRSMSVDADQRLADLLTRDPRAASEWAQDHKLRRDPRITAFGRFLRTTNLDELPQLINILIGDMSLVGPRPIVAAEIERYGTRFSAYCATRPGLTGLWQVSGRNDLPYPRRVELDAWYVENRTLALDIKILFQTLVTGGRGAY